MVVDRGGTPLARSPLWRISTNVLKHLALQDSLQVVELQDMSRYFTDMSQRYYQDIIQLEMVVPLIRARVIEPGEFPDGGDRANIGAFRPIAKGAGVSKITGVCRATVFLADDVIDLASEESIIFMNAAILAPTMSSGSHELAELYGDVASHRSE